MQVSASKKKSFCAIDPGIFVENLKKIRYVPVSQATEMYFVGYCIFADSFICLQEGGVLIGFFNVES